MYRKYLGHKSKPRVELNGILLSFFFLIDFDRTVNFVDEEKASEESNCT